MLRSTLVLMLVLTFIVPVFAQQKPITVDDVMDIAGASSPEISPDGNWIVYSRSDLKWKDNKRESSLWMISTDGKEHFRLTAQDNDGGPSWSPDSKLIAFMRGSGEGGRQIWVIRAAGGEAWKLSDHKDGISSFEWPPDGKSIVFISSDIKPDAVKEAEKKGDDAIYVDEGPNGQSSGRWSNVWVVDLAEKKEREVTKEQWLISGLSVSPDGKQVALHARRENQRNAGNMSEIHIVDLSSGAITKMTDNRAPESQVQWSPDGKSLSYVAGHDKEWELYNGKIWILDLATKKTRNASGRFEGSISRYFWSEDGKKILFSGQQKTFHNLFELDAASGAVRQLTEEPGLLRTNSMSKDLKRAATTFESPQKPADINVLDVTTLERKPLTDLNPQMKNFALAKTQVMTWLSTDSTPIEGILYLPPNYQIGSRVPFILNIHGGPAGVWSYGFNGIANVYAGLGYAVLEPNVRGSSGYSDALLRGNIQNIGGGDFMDAISGVNAMINNGVADPDRLAVKGWSYGGILGGWTITQTDRFKAAALGAMVSDWSSEYAMGFNHDVKLWYIGGSPWENAEKYRAQSSYTHIANVKTPTLLLHGEQDTTDTIGQSMIFYQALKDRGVDTRFIRFPREPHGFREPHHQRIRDLEEISWFEKYVKGAEFKAEPRK